MQTLKHSKRAALLVTCALGFSLAGSTLVGCGPSREAYSPAEKKTKYSDDVLFIAARDSIKKLGYEPVKVDFETHSVETRPKEVSVSMTQGTKYVYAFHVTAMDGELRVEAMCQENSSLDAETMEDCGDSQPERVINEMNKLQAQILETAKTTDDPNTDWNAKPAEEVAGGDEEVPEEEEKAPAK